MAVGDEHAGQASKYLDYLPAIYQQDVEPRHPKSLGRLLLAFEHMLTGLGDSSEPGLEEILDGIADSLTRAVRLAGLHRYFDPGPNLPDNERAPKEFLEWLAGWVALTLRGDLDELRQRDFIARVASLYRQRGTRRGLEKIIGIYTRLAATINEVDTPLQIGVRSRIGTDTTLDGGAPHFFRVLIRLTTPNPEEIRRYREVVTAIIEIEKPAHTYYVLDAETPMLQIGVHSRVGVDTLLGLTPGHH
jgi:phage tail-like protein